MGVWDVPGLRLGESVGAVEAIAATCHVLPLRRLLFMDHFGQLARRASDFTRLDAIPLLGFHCTKPLVRAGLLWHLEGRRIVELPADMAAMEISGESEQTRLIKPVQGGVPSSYIGVSGLGIENQTRQTKSVA